MDFPVPGAPVNTIRRTGADALLLWGVIMDTVAFKNLLEQNYTWPSIYMFKFVCPASNENIAYLEGLFNSETSEIQIRQSSKGNFVSVTAKELMLSADQVIERYAKVKEIPGLLSL